MCIIEMKDKETIFKEAIKNNLENQLQIFGYSKVDEFKGYLKFKCPNNYLGIFFEWNRDYSFYSKLWFHSNENYEYSISSIVRKLEKDDRIEEPTFSKDFQERIEEWSKQLSYQLTKYKIHEIDNDNSVIVGIRNERDERNEKYNKELEVSQLKKEADSAWNLKDFKSFVKIIKGKTDGLPSSYKKKLSIAEKKI